MTILDKTIVVVSEEVNEGRGLDIENALKGTKTGVGSKVDDMFREYRNALRTVTVTPSHLKDYLSEVGIELSDKERKANNNAIDACGEVIKILK